MSQSEMPISWLFGVYRAQCRMTLARYLQYRIELHIWLAQIILRPIVFMVVWSVATSSTGGSVHGYTPRDFAAYFLISMLVHHFALAWMMIEWEPLVKTGDLSYALVRPVHILHRYIAENLTFKSATMPFMLVTTIGLALVFKPAFHFTGWALLAAVPALLLAAALYFTITWAMGLLSFFTTEIDAVNIAFALLMLLFAGQMGPVAIVPQPIQWLSFALPFWWMIGFPTELILGHLTQAQALQGMLVQSGWLAAWSLLTYYLWRRGLKMYTAVGI